MPKLAQKKRTCREVRIAPGRVAGADPYPSGELGVIKEGAYADVLLWEENPLENIKVILDEDKLKIIMKDGKIYKNTL